MASTTTTTTLYSPLLWYMVTLIVISKKDGGDWLPEITKANRNRQPAVHVERLILGRTYISGIQGTQTNTDTRT